MAYETEERLIHALMNGVALDTCPAAYQIIMGMALSIHISDCKLQRPLDHFSKYLLAYAEDQERVAQQKGA